jgi:hypothetical protein
MRRSWPNMRGKPLFVSNVQARRGDPAGSPYAPRIQIAVYGGRVVRVKGTSSDRLSLCLRAAEQFG